MGLQPVVVCATDAEVYRIMFTYEDTLALLLLAAVLLFYLTRLFKVMILDKTPLALTRETNIDKALTRIDKLLYDRESDYLSEIQLCLMSQDITTVVLKSYPSTFRRFLPRPVGISEVIGAYYRVVDIYSKVYASPHNQAFSFSFAHRISDDIFFKGRSIVQQEIGKTDLTRQSMRGIL